ncbi:MAG: 3-isopropylmalate dehydratase small subunit [Dehalococcoidia bacterium]|nr:MAG: 3-isopropylmalate dehydratase small subunit [Dehalococcoidia bacterium]
MKLKGVVHKYGANVDTDAIIPARYLNVSEPGELAGHCMEGIDGEFLSRVKPDDIIVATTNFGCGSSREHAPIAIKAVGISCVIAQSFARIFFRNAINIGLPLFECAQADEIEQGDELEVALEKGEISDITRNKVFKAEPYPDFMLQIISTGGLIEYTRKKIEARGSQ